MGLRSLLNTPLTDDVAATLIWSRSRSVRFFCDAVFGLPFGLSFLWIVGFVTLEYPLLLAILKELERTLNMIPGEVILFGVVPVLLLAPALVCMAQLDQKRYGWIAVEIFCGVLGYLVPLLLMIIALSYILHIRPALSARIASRTHA